MPNAHCLTVTVNVVSASHDAYLSRPAFKEIPTPDLTRTKSSTLSLKIEVKFSQIMIHIENEHGQSRVVRMKE